MGIMQGEHQIYGYRCADTGRFLYVGKTNNPRRRDRDHRRGEYPGIDKYLAKHPATEFIVFGSCPADLAADGERQMIAALRPPLNMTDGGEGQCGRIVSLETRFELSRKLRGVPKPPRSAKHCANLSASLAGKKRKFAKRKPRTTETKARLAEKSRAWAAANPDEMKRRAQLGAAARWGKR